VSGWWVCRRAPEARRLGGDYSQSPAVHRVQLAEVQHHGPVSLDDGVQDRAQSWSVDTVHLAADSERRACVHKADGDRTLPERILGRGHFGVTAFGRAAGGGRDGDHERQLAADWTSPKRLGKCQHATLRTVRATVRDWTRSRCLRMAADHSRRLRRPSLSKVIATLHLDAEVARRQLSIFLVKCYALG